MKKQLRNTIRKLLLRENASHEDKLATMIGSLDPASIVQALNLGESIGLVEEYSEETREKFHGLFQNKVTIEYETTWTVRLKRSLAEKIEDAIKRNPNPSSSYPFSSNLNQELLQYDELPPFTEIQIRTQE